MLRKVAMVAGRTHVVEKVGAMRRFVANGALADRPPAIGLLIERFRDQVGAMTLLTDHTCVSADEWHSLVVTEVRSALERVFLPVAAVAVE